MPHPLEAKIEDVRKRARGLLVAGGAGMVAALGVGAALVAGLLDYLVRSPDAGFRVLLTLAVVLTFAAAGWRYLWKPTRKPITLLSIAQRIERLHPKLADRLSSALEFASQPEHDPQAGSADLRRAVVAEAASVLETIDVHDVVEPRPAMRCAAVGGLVSALAVAIVLLDPYSAALAAARLAWPFGGPEWPRRHELYFENAPARVAAGQPLELKLRDRRGQLPAEVRFFVRPIVESGDPPPPDVERFHVAGEELAIRRGGADSAWEYRVEGGDDATMPWTRVDVVPPPAIRDLIARVAPPEYLGLPEQPSDLNLRAVRGSVATITGATDKPLRSAALRFERGEPAVATLAPDRKSFRVSFAIDRSTGYHLQVEDEEGFTGGAERKWDVQAVEDEAPTVVWEQPSSNINVSTRGLVPIKALFRDDFALAGAALHWGLNERRPPDAPPMGPTPASVDSGVVSLYALAPERRGPIALEHAGGQGDRRAVEATWDLATLGVPLKSGDKIEVVLVGRDFKPQEGRSPSRFLAVLGDVELVDRIVGRQSVVLDKLRRALKLESDSRRQAHESNLRLAAAERANRADVDALQGAELTHRQAESALLDPTEGAAAIVDSILADLANNRLDDPDTTARLEALRDGLGELRSSALPQIGGRLNTAVKLAQEAARAAAETNPPAAIDPTAKGKLNESLAAATSGQDDVVDALQSMLKNLSEWDDARRFRQELREIVNEQNDLAGKTAAALPKTLGRRRDDLSAEDQATLAAASARQDELAAEVARLMQRMQKAGAQQSEADPEVAGAIEDALATAEERAIVGRMRSAAGEVADNNVGGAAQTQKAVANDLQEMLDALSNRPETDPAKLAAKLKQAEQDLARLKADQGKTAGEFADAAKSPAGEERKNELMRLTRRQKQLQNEAERMARRLQRLQARAAGDKSKDAAAKMQAANQAGKSDDAQGAADQAKAAEKDLDDVTKELAERRRQAEADLAFEQLAKIQDALRGLHDRQQAALEETRRLHALQSAAPLSPAQEQSLRDLAEVERALQGETLGFVERVRGAIVFELALQGTAGEMEHAADLLDGQETGEPTQTAEDNAVRRLAQLLAALEMDPPDPNDQPQQPRSGDQQPGQQKPPSDAIADAAQLKMIKLLQEEVNQRTLALETARVANQDLTDDQLREYRRLAAEQGRVADLLRELLDRQADAADKSDAGDSGDAASDR